MPYRIFKIKISFYSLLVNERENKTFDVFQKLKNSLHELNKINIIDSHFCLLKVFNIL